MRRTAVNVQGGGLKRAGVNSLPVTSYDNDSLDDCCADQNAENYDRRFSVIYGKVSTRKHKKWEGDGILLCKERVAVLKTENGADVARSSAFARKELAGLEEGSRLVVGGYEVEVQNQITEASASSDVPQVLEYSNSALEPPLKRKYIPVGRQFVQPFTAEYLKEEGSPFIVNEKDVENGMPPVVLDNRIARHLRPHQKEGIQFLYEKLKDPGSGAILADEMGLGKSVQTISLLISLIRQNRKGRGSQEKYLLIVPSSLLGNWQCEFAKWLVQSRALLFKISKATELQSYLRSIRCSPIAIMSYEMAAYIGEPLINIRFALVVCDEAHRLKNPSGRMYRLVSSLQAERRLLLTGTPLQNDSNELFALLDLARPGVFGTLAQFNRLFRGSSEEPTNLRDLLAETLLRRTAEVNCNYLPQKNEYLLFCRMSELQSAIYDRIRDFVTSDHLSLIDMLKKLCNHPSILYQSAVNRQNSGSEGVTLYSRVFNLFPSSFGNSPPVISDSGKLSVFLELMSAAREAGEKVVVVSNFTTTLGMLESVCEKLGFTIFRLDGSVLQQKRMQVVNEFNSTSQYNSVFLLSTKAGGVGLNLVGASRLILFDSEWNPAVDAQAMARIWRDGQTKPCHIYRLITTGAIDEKILQRQVMKSGLSTVIEGEQLAESVTTQFSDEDLSDIFSMDLKTLCNTHDLMECDCEGCGLLPAERDALDEEEATASSSRTIEEQEETAEEDLLRSTKSLSAEEANENLATRGNAEVSGTEASTASSSTSNESAQQCAEPVGDRQSDSKSNNDENSSSASTDVKEAVAPDPAENLPPNIAMAALLQWRHYSQQHSEQFQLFKAQAGLSKRALDDVTFVMKIVRNY